MELVSWGKEGETYEVVDGKKSFITDESGAQANTLYGFSTYGVFTRMYPEAALSFNSAEIAETREMVLENMMPYANPLYTLSLNEDEQKVKEEYLNAIDRYTEEMVVKFILGQEPLSKFSEFQSTLNEMGLQKLLETYQSAYDRVK